MSVRSLITINELYNWKSLATLDCFAPYLVNEYCSICLEMAFIYEEFGTKILMVVAAVEE